MNKLIWKTESKQDEELRQRIGSYEKGKSRDGYILAAEGEFDYKGIKYLIKVLRYFNHTNKFTAIGRDRISDKHCVVEYPDETKPIKDMIPSEFESEFLFHDTLHSWNDKQTIEEQIKTCHKWAKEDIDNLLNGEISKRIEEGINRLNEIRDKLNSNIIKICQKK